MIVHQGIKHEGFWLGSSYVAIPAGMTAEPLPEAEKEPWDGQGEFVERMRSFEKGLRREFDRMSMEGVKTAHPYVSTRKGHFSCSVCGELAGVFDYEYCGWRWPSGLVHHIEEANIRPSDDFIRFVTIGSRQLK